MGDSGTDGRLASRLRELERLVAAQETDLDALGSILRDVLARLDELDEKLVLAVRAIVSPRPELRRRLTLAIEDEFGPREAA